MRIYTLIILYCCIAGYTQAQNNDNLFKGYVATGFNATQIAGDLLAGYRKLGLNVGVGTYIMYDKKKRFSNSIEITYSMKGSQSNFKNNDPEFFRKYVMDYVGIPVLFNYHDKDKEGKDIATFSGGIALYRLVRQKFTIGGIEQRSEFKEWEVAGVFSVIFHIKEKFGIEGRLTYSLSNAHKGDTSYVVYSKNGQVLGVSRARNGGLYHNVFSVRCLYFFN